MTTQNELKTGAMIPQLEISRVFNAPRSLVWDAWTKPEHLNRWWGPAGTTLKVAKFDFNPGGMFLYSMTAPDGGEMWGRFIYNEITPPERLSFVNSFTDADGNITRAPFIATWPLEIRNILTLNEVGSQTEVHLKGGPINATQEELDTFNSFKDNMQEGFKGTFDQLDAFLANIQNTVNK